MIYLYTLYLILFYASFVNIFVNYKRNYIQCEKYTNHVIKRKKTKCCLLCCVYNLCVLYIIINIINITYIILFFSYDYYHILLDFLL